MLWTVAELKIAMVRKPMLGPALWQMVAQKLVNANNRIASLCLEPVNRRLANTLLHLADRFGKPTEDNLVHLLPITHNALAYYVGTSREVVSYYMNQFRRARRLGYSRRGIYLDVGALKRYLADSQGSRRLNKG
jgi:CRP-like cAMP-binding protein